MSMAHWSNDTNRGNWSIGHEPKPPHWQASDWLPQPCHNQVTYYSHVATLILDYTEETNSVSCKSHYSLCSLEMTANKNFTDNLWNLSVPFLFILIDQ